MPKKRERTRKDRASLYQRMKLRTEARMGILDRLEIEPFRGLGNGKEFLLEGRLLESKGVSQPTEDSGLFQNVANTIRRFDSDEIPGARMRATFRGRRYETVTDREGYFSFTFDGHGASRPGWHTANIELIESLADQSGITAKGRMLLPSPKAEFMVVSDLDDTVVRTGAFDRLTMVRVVMSKNARTRSPFPGVSRLYRELEKGPDGRGKNPLFYVSRSGWNLYDLFERFLDEHDLPMGPILLRDLSTMGRPSRVVSHHRHKVHRIEQILSMYPSLPLVLIGDSGQDDPETYESIVKKHASRIRAVYLRDVTGGKRDHEVAAVVKRIEKRGIPALATEDTVSLAVHAAEVGLLRTTVLNDIRKSRDAALVGARTHVFR